MNRLGLVALVLSITAGCQNAPSKLDGIKGSAAPGGAAAEAPAVAADHSGDTEARLRRLEDNYAKHAEALDFLGKVYAQQKAQQQQQRREEHDPNAMFAVPVDRNVAAGMVEGPATASVTIVEAFDFA